MLRLPSATLACAALLTALWLSSGCGSQPQLNPTGDGPYVHADATSGGMRSGLAHAPAAGMAWPPAPAEAQAGQCTNERESLERDLDVKPVACPRVEMVRSTPAEGDAETPIDTGGFSLTCYQLGTRVLVVEYQHGATLCMHIVGLALFQGSK